VVDPGPDAAGHRARLLDAAGRGNRCGAAHPRHADHSAGAPALAALVRGCPVRAVDPAYRVGAGELADGDVLAVAGARLRVISTRATPRTRARCCCTATTAWSDCSPGDTVLGRGTTVVAAPDGHLGAYLDSLDRLGGLVADEGVSQLLPATVRGSATPRNG
jgi:glyoxylase-like metal-dependent hydrolase (beta-lactamase superfamily II)